MIEDETDFHLIFAKAVENINSMKKISIYDERDYKKDILI